MFVDSLDRDGERTVDVVKEALDANAAQPAIIRGSGGASAARIPGMACVDAGIAAVVPSVQVQVEGPQVWWGLRFGSGRVAAGGCVHASRALSGGDANDGRGWVGAQPSR